MGYGGVCGEERGGCCTLEDNYYDHERVNQISENMINRLKQFSFLFLFLLVVLSTRLRADQLTRGVVR